MHIRAKDFDLFWEKGDSVNRYVFNGKEYTVAGKGTPDFLQDSFGLVKIAEGKELIQVSDQFSPIFLLDQSGTVVADVLSDVARLDSINVAMRLVEKDRKEAASNRKLREKDVLELKLRVMAYDGLDAVMVRVRAVETSQRALDMARMKLDEIDRILTTAFSLARDIKSLAKTNAVVVPEIVPIQDQDQAFTNVCRLAVSVAKHQTAIESLEDVATIVIPDADLVREKQGTFTQLHGWMEKLRSSKDILTRWKVLEATPIPDTEGLSGAAEHLQGLAALAQRYAATTKTVGALEAEYQEAAVEEVAVAGEIDTLGLCPMCTQPISSERHTHAGVAGV